MKKFLTLAFFTLLATLSFAEKAKLTIKNTVGADLDEVGEYDAFTHSKETDVNDDTSSETAFAFGDQFQADFESSFLTARARLEFLYTSADDALAQFLVVPSGFVHITPIQHFGIIAGNNFYKYFAIPSAYLAAADDTTKYGRLLTDSLGEERYFGNDTVSLFSNGFAGGVTSNWTFGSVYAKLAGGATIYPDSDEVEKAIDFGINAGLENIFDVGFTAHNITEADRKFGAFAGLTAIPNFILNAGFYYNFTTTDYLPEARVTRSDVDEFKKQKTKYALGLSTGYEFTGAGLGVYADVISGLTNEYIGEIKYYDSDGNLINTETTTIVRGATIVKYKNSKAKRTDEFPHEGIPFYSQFRVTYKLTDSIESAFNVKLRTLLHDASSTWLTFYPRVSVKVPALSGTIGAGIRLDMNFTRYEGISSISVPFTYTYKFKKKIKL